MIQTLINITGQKLILPFYHVVSNDKLPHIQHLYRYRNIQQFTKELDAILKVYHPISPDELLQQITNKEKLKKPSVLLSFDDGFHECSSVISPILISKGLPAIFFVNTDFIDNKALMYRCKISLIIDKIKLKGLNDIAVHTIANTYQIRQASAIIPFLHTLKIHQSVIIDHIGDILSIDFNDFLKQRTPYLSSNDVQQLHHQGFSIGSHGVNHPYFSDLNDEHQMMQLIESFDALNQILPVSQHFFSFPFTDYKINSERLKEISTHVDLSFGTAGLKQENIATHLQRIPMENQYLQGLNTIYWQYCKWMGRAILNKNIIKRD